MQSGRQLARLLGGAGGRWTARQGQGCFQFRALHEHGGRLAAGGAMGWSEMSRSVALRFSNLGREQRSSAESEEKVEKKDHGSSKAVLPPKGRGKKWVAQLHVQAFDPQVNEFACNYIRHLAGLCGVRTGNIVRLPTRKELITILRSPHVDKKAREQTLDERPPVGVMITIRDKEGISAPPPSQ
eukprot:753197-Hanusia_phi.AAC.5